MSRDNAIVIGAGMGGLAAAMRLAAAGLAVDLFDAGEAPGGKMRTFPSAAGPVDAGPTVLTLREVFDDLFADCGLRLDDHVSLVREPVLARHFWPDGSTLDLTGDEAADAEAIAALSGARAARQFRRVSAETRRLWAAFDAPVMRAPRPRLAPIAVRVAADPALLRAMAPLSSMAGHLHRRFDDPRLAQLFGRYATYVGAAPARVPALLSLVWQAEARGVWRVEGGMGALAAAMARAAESLGARLHQAAPVARIEDGPCVVLEDGSRHAAGRVVFAGDPRALHAGLLGPAPAAVVPRAGVEPRSLSAVVMAFAATPRGVDLHHHNVFFGADPKTEFGPIARGEPPRDPTIYVCAQDRGTGRAPPTPERFETIVNAAPLPPTEESPPWFDRTIPLLARRGLHLDPAPGQRETATPRDFARRFPGSLGAIYGRSPEGTTATFRRPTARTAMAGLYLAGGGVHPGAGVPMAALSGKHAADAILSDRPSTSTCPRTATPGGTSTGSPTTARAPSRSSGS